MKKFYIVMAAFTLVILTGITYSQDKPAAKPAEDPAKIELTVEQTKQVTDAQKDAQLATLQAENLTLKIQQAQDELKKLQETAQTKQKALATLFTSVTNLSIEKLQNYSVEEKDGKIVLTKK